MAAAEATPQKLVSKNDTNADFVDALEKNLKEKENKKLF